MLEKYLNVHPEVKKALAEGLPVVALESTIISHGMPYPKNIEMAKTVSKIIRENGAIPATIAIIDGVLKVGLTTEEIEFLGTSKDVVKASRRDLPFIISKKLNGATTVATTMILANLAGVKVFATGGIGGVHRGAQETFDISADLQELANTNVAVICAGAKSILDIGLTLEYLETNGVPVVGFETEEFPAFYTRKSGFGVDYKVESSLEVASALKAKWDLNLKGGMVIGNPIPKEFEMDYDTINNAIESALKEAEEKNIAGKKVTPFLLDRVKTITDGKSLDANIELVYNNAKVAAQIAKDLSELK
ncbi:MULTISPECIES: pseudouridine-5'-phosphate glycosidase [Paraclostridium]|uniref:Pseudouridine-5'-phosphate glycosidase n=1 Tax=Paraclostridium bifermentans ATCC 638 = DSM 14991 TaxID=1233171 RepID=T4VI85_PARBF|nr:MULTISPECIES: pseudouridine-5'-phosphate glycosidase [Paraclostridium]MDV8113854.1 pseudouridine-5'-phosphate glycosidase [Bacillus sp. BAU-SS-2023]EQK40476.1 indigoidine synthase A like family protein [[Clostridium] bifermentans ATCC 638] [Paraclostridium bifermentans ATCC 638 = DSM 14991]MBZ6007115.1 pseudouridine-5'-phosphate glycosidase [Paraclostridium bifermentans]MDU0295884.1 pseudouridine-5'-phosphate glycosidase [Paraclostridium sp. MRS3W1]RIZ58660.1 pseudouridine-5'-phosphate glyc